MAFTFMQCRDFQLDFKNLLQRYLASARFQQMLSGGVLKCVPWEPSPRDCTMQSSTRCHGRGLTWEGWGLGWKQLMTGKVSWVEMSHDFLVLCPFDTRSPCCSVPFRRKEKPSWRCLAQSIYLSNKANRLFLNNHSLKHQGINSCPQSGYITSLGAPGVTVQS